MPFSECHDALRPRSKPVLSPFYPALALAATVFFAQSVTAQMRLDESCVFQDGSPESCTHVVACIGGDTLFVGGTTGWDSGTLSGELYTGETCTGVWNNAEARAEFSCGDGLEGTVQYLRRDDPTGTAIGQGTMADGRNIEAWSGDNIAEFVRRETGQVTLQCGTQDLLIM